MTPAAHRALLVLIALLLLAILLSLQGWQWAPGGEVL